MDNIERLTCHVDLPLCVNQERILLSEELLNRHLSVCPVVSRIGVHLRGPLDLKLLEEVLNTIVCRHSALRVAFHRNVRVPGEARANRLRAFGRTGLFEPGLYLQTVRDGVHLKLRSFDLHTHKPEERDERLKTILDLEASTPFEIDKPPLVRAAVIKIDKDEHVLIIVVDRLVFDRYSKGIMAKEIQLLYAQVSGRPLRVDLPSISHPDFAAWQGRMFQTSYFDQSVEYWKRQWFRFGFARLGFQDFPFVLPMPKTPSFVFGSEHLLFDRPSSQEIKSFAKKSRTTLFMVFLAAYATVLSQYTKRKTVAIYGNFANRDRRETQNVLGYFSNRHLLGVDLSLEPSGSTLLNEIRDTVLGACSHQDLPLPFLWHSLRRCPRFDGVRVLLDCAVSDRFSSDNEIVGLNMSDAALPPSRSPRSSNLGLYVKDDWDQISLRLRYSVDRFPPIAIRYLLADLCEIVIGLVSDPNARVGGGSRASDRYSGRFRDPKAAK